MHDPKTKREHVAPESVYETPLERIRRELEARGFPDGPDYEALIFAEDEEYEEPIY